MKQKVEELNSEDENKESEYESEMEVGEEESDEELSDALDEENLSLTQEINLSIIMDQVDVSKDLAFRTFKESSKNVEMTIDHLKVIFFSSNFNHVLISSN